MRNPVAFALLLAGAACSGKPAPAGGSSTTPATAVAQSSPTSPSPASAVGFSIEARDAAGVKQWITQQQGRPVLVNFWATWCQPCVGEMPDLLRGTREFRQRGGVVVGVALEQLVGDLTAAQAIEKVGAKARELGIDFPVLVCTDDEMKAIREAIGVEIGGLPQTLTYDKQGKLVHQHEGAADAAEFDELTKQAER